MTDDPNAVSASKRERGRQRSKGPAGVVGPTFGDVSRSVAALVESMGEITPGQSVLASAALVLAGELDRGAGMAAAAVSKELRATMAELGGDDGDGDDAFSEWERQLSNPG